MIDAHIHIDSRSREELEIMSLAGIDKVIVPTYYPHLYVSVSSSTIFDVYERAIRFEVQREKEYFIDVYVAVSINPVCIPEDYAAVLEKLPSYLREKRVVAIGEIGLDPSSLADLHLQREILIAQLDLAKEYDKPLIFHLPHSDKGKWVDEYLDMIYGKGIEPSNVIIDHADQTVLKKITDANCYAGITVQPWRKLSAEDAAKILKGNNLDYMILNSDCNSTMPSDPLAVPKTALEMRKLGFSKVEIEKVTNHNAAKALRLP